jgi:hypothetical protein
MLRPGLIQPVDGVRFKTPSYRQLYGLARPLFPDAILTITQLGKVMLILVRDGAPKLVLKSADIRSLLSSIHQA